MWTVIYMVDGMDLANIVKEKLTQEGFLVKINTSSKDGETGLCEILVPEGEANEAHSVLIDIGY